MNVHIVHGYDELNRCDKLISGFLQTDFRIVVLGLRCVIRVQRHLF